MANTSRQVHTRQLQKMSKMRAEDFKKLLESFMPPMFPPVVGTKRKYPGDTAGAYLCEFLKTVSRFPTQEKVFLTSLRTLQRLEQAVMNRDVLAVHRIRKKGLYPAYDRLTEMVNRRKWAAGVTEDGVVFRPKTAEGKAALAIFLLEKQRRLNRMRKCLHCGAWFYARFSQQQFCRDPQTKCQWKHYHTPEWRKKHREQNRKHQSEYRKRNPGRRQ
jgi:hypothetical protein